MFEITPNLNPNDQKPLYIQLYQYLLKEIETGRIPQGTRLPSIRTLAGHLGIGKNTVDAAYQQLIAEGFILSKPKSGLYVAEFDEQFFTTTQESRSKFSHLEAAQPLAITYPFDFRHGHIDKDHFPVTIWRKLTNQVLYDQAIFSYGDRQGEPELRVELAKYLYQSRGVSCLPEQIIIGGGIQQLLSLLCFIIKSGCTSVAGENPRCNDGKSGQQQPNHYEKVAFENPGYDGAREVFRQHGFSIIPIELNTGGIDLKKLVESNARIVYVTPSHQFPMGMIMPIANRMKLIQWANRVDGYIIEDDYDSEFRYKGKPIPALQGIDSFGKVIYLGTFSKALLPSIRLAYMVLPEQLLKSFQTHFQSYEQPVSKILQKTVALFMQEGYWQKHLRRMRHIYQKKHETLHQSIRKFMGEQVKIIGEESGLHLLIEVKNGDNEETLIEKAKSSGVKIYPTAKYWMNQNQAKDPLLLVGFGGLSETEITEGIRRLSEAWF
ncbi:MocR-like pyridoxine biosynthesis transcription factor PdxR [Caldifermentibacillus hisashii]|uniref:MocR-like pyridoxine biosynthesis transcription factor PdxR n=1 Tax=Caldifermentibacillus hisashii TaxID=996558 RepID=UPI0022B9B8D4|nr:PLP-dependent aminotransferase family protein [Caldifermentibacillus hisashii]